MLVAVAGTLATFVIAGSLAAIAYVTVVRANERQEAVSLDEERLTAYREIMAAIVALNRTAVELGGEQFYHEVDKFLMDKDSVLADPHAEVTAKYQQYYHILPPEVYEAVTEYVNYLSKYHDEGAQVEKLLSLGGEVGRAMRQDLGLEPVSSKEAPLE